MRIKAIGGYDAVGKNLTTVTIDNKTVILDNGIRLDQLQLYDMSSDELTDPKHKLEFIEKGVVPDSEGIEGEVVCQVISHGHLDHIGAIGINRFNVPIFTTPYAAEMGKSICPGGDIRPAKYREITEISEISKFSIEFVEITHSMPHSSISVVHTEEGDVVYASDFKFDDRSKIAKIDYKRLKELGNGNVRALIVESTRVSEEGKTPSESIVKSKLRDVFDFIDEGLIIITTFSTHIERIQSIVDLAVKAGRIPVFMGRSLISNVQISKKMGLLKIPSDAKLFRKSKSVKNMLKEIEKEREKYALLVTGHQGEENSVLRKLADTFKFEKKDSVIFSSEVIPTPINIANRYSLEAKLRAKHVRLFKDIHVSGHASKEDHRKLINILKPEYIIPCHGSLEMRSAYIPLAIEEGYELNKNLILLCNGNGIEI